MIDVLRIRLPPRRGDHPRVQTRGFPRPVEASGLGRGRIRCRSVGNGIAAFHLEGACSHPPCGRKLGAMRHRPSSSALFLVAFVAACSASNGKGGPEGDDAGGGGDSTFGGDGQTDTSGFNVDVLPEVKPSCGTGDCDKDGYKEVDGDCNDFDATINPEAFDFLADSIDNDCNGAVDDPIVHCASDAASKDPTEVVRSMDMCKQKTRTKSGALFDPLSKAE